MRRPVNYCSVSGCSTRTYGNGYCAKHYMRMRRNGTLATVKAENGARLAWVEDSALPWRGNECCIFPFPAGSHGYGDLTSPDGGKVLMHRYVCEQTHGLPPTPLHQAAHRCGEKLCGNPRHLRWATVSENAADKILHGRHVQGEAHGNAKLSRTDVLSIRKAKGPQGTIAEKYGIVQQTVSDIKRGRRWSWL